MAPTRGLAVLTACALIAAGCGQDDLPSGTAARIGAATISTSDVAAYARSHPGGGERARALGALIEAHWLVQDARRRGLDVSAGNWRTATQTRLLRARLLRALSPTPAQVAAYYRAHRSDFGPARRRDAWFVRVDRLAAASAVRGRLARGGSWEGSIRAAQHWDPHARGAALPFVERRASDMQFNAALFAARIGRIVGPKRTRRGWYVFQAFREYDGPAKPPPRVQPAVEAELRAQLLATRLRARYGPETRCAQDYATAPPCPASS